MSLLTLGAVAIARDLTGQGDPLAKDATVSKTRLVGVGDDQSVEPPTTTEPAAPTTAAVASFGQLLVAQIPSEALIAYTTLLALFSASGGSYTSALWAVYGAAIVVCAVAVLAGYLAQRDYTFDDTDGAQGATTATTTGSAATGSTTETTVTGPAQNTTRPGRRTIVARTRHVARRKAPPAVPAGSHRDALHGRVWADRAGISPAIGLGHRIRTLVRLSGRRRRRPDVRLRAAAGQGKRRQRDTQTEVVTQAPLGDLGRTTGILLAKCFWVMSPLQ